MKILKTLSRSLLLCLLVSVCGTAFGQYRKSFDFYHPFFLYERNTHGVKVERCFSVDPVTKERRLVNEVHYDRNGYVVSPAYVNTYDNQGRLIRRQKYSSRSSIANGGIVQQVLDGTEIIQYDATGLVSLYVDTQSLSTVTTYRLIGSKSHPKYGLCEVDYQITVEEFGKAAGDDPGLVIDTFKMMRTYNNQGQVIRESVESVVGWLFTLTYDFLFQYDDAGRLIQQKSGLYEYFDSINYTYTATERIGKGMAYNEGFEADVTQHFTLDGVLKELHYFWKDMLSPNNPDPDEDYIEIYNCRGDLIRTESVEHSTPPKISLHEYEREYWQ